MKKYYLKALILFGLAALMQGCYTQVASGYDDYYGERKEQYRSQPAAQEYQESSPAENDSEQSDDNYAYESNGTSTNYCFGGGTFPHYRRYFWHYHPSYSFSVCMGNPYPPRWWDPWFGWYDPCFPATFYEPYWYWYDYSPWYWIHPSTTVYYTHNSYGSRDRYRDNTRIRDIGGRTPITGRDLTRLGGVQTRQRNDGTLAGIRRERNTSTGRNPFIMTDRPGRNPAIITSREHNGRGTQGGLSRGSRSGVTIDGTRRSDRNSDRSADINTRLRAREKDSRNDVFKQDRGRKSSLGDLDPAYRNDRGTKSGSRQTDRSKVEKNSSDRRESTSTNRSGDRKSGTQNDSKSSGNSRDQKKQESRSYSAPGRSSSPSYTPSNRQSPSYSPAPRSSGSAPSSAPRSSGSGSAPRSGSRERR